ncbi:synaptophysin-like [Chrysoperla carnea]|uniref:synaptophysin-like n=1 Tax=Chrysoperla carnea TaxID=189513 RepID=UPI001D064654|nr:synaptophysin-like [Chrysoperla carnea]
MLDLSVFKEPLGIMRVFQFIFAFLAFSCTTSYTNELNFNCKAENGTIGSYAYPIEYPFDVKISQSQVCANSKFTLYADFSFEAHFFFITGLLSILYAIGISVVYALIEDVYKNDKRFPFLDFGATVILAVFWLSGSAAWAYGVSGLKSVTDPTTIKTTMSLDCCTISRSGFTRLTISIIFGFLNFFLWASDLWFVYKETAWFQSLSNQAPSGV